MQIVNKGHRNNHLLELTKNMLVVVMVLIELQNSKKLLKHWMNYPLSVRIFENYLNFF